MKKFCKRDSVGLSISLFFYVISGSNFHVYELEAQCGLWQAICSFCHLIRHQESTGGKRQAGGGVCDGESLSGSMAVMLCEHNRSSSKSLDLCVQQVIVTELSGGLIFWDDGQTAKSKDTLLIVSTSFSINRL